MKRIKISQLKLNQMGFTLAEVLAVLAIISILGLIAIPSVLNTIQNSKISTYSLMIEDIKVAAQELFEEVEYLDSNLYHYDSNGKTSNKVEIEQNKYIVIQLQTLVSNGFLSGTNNENATMGIGGNQNKKILLDPQSSNDLGICWIKISKDINTHGKIVYKVERLDETTVDSCPTTADYQK